MKTKRIAKSGARMALRHAGFWTGADIGTPVVVLDDGGSREQITRVHVSHDHLGYDSPSSSVWARPTWWTRDQN